MQLRRANQWVGTSSVPNPGAGKPKKNRIKAKNMPLFNPHRLNVTYKRTHTFVTISFRGPNAQS
jgi:hypothetical protein